MLEVKNRLQRKAKHAFSYQWNGADYFVIVCLLYTSDAADERSSVDLGGRRIINKKTEQALSVGLELIQLTTNNQ